VVDAGTSILEITAKAMLPVDKDKCQFDLANQTVACFGVKNNRFTV